MGAMLYRREAVPPSKSFINCVFCFIFFLNATELIPTTSAQFTNHSTSNDEIYLHDEVECPYLHAYPPYKMSFKYEADYWVNTTGKNCIIIYIMLSKSEMEVFHEHDLQ